jgi:hypothetical protein
MLQQLDTLIGFAVVMSVVSLLITISTQMISSLLGLRGSNLADGLAAMLHKIVPALEPKVRKELIDHVLTRPVLSDSLLSMSDSRWDKIPVVAWFRKRWKRASAIRPDELLDVLKDLAGASPDQASARLAALQAPVAPPTAAPGAAPAGAAAHAQPAAMPLEVAALQILAALHVATPATTAAVTPLSAQLPGLTQTGQTQVNAVIAQLNDATGIASNNLEKWFNSAQDRAQQWFAIHARFWTVAGAIFMAFILQLDTFRLINKLSSDPNERAKLIQFSQATLQGKADEVFTNSLSAAAIYRQAIQQLETSNSIPGIERLGAVPASVKLETQSAAESWLTQQAQSDQLNVAAVLSAYRSTVQNVSQKNYDQAGAEITDLTRVFTQTGIQLMPQPYPAPFTQDWKLWSWPWAWKWSGVWSWPADHLFGILTSAALLSLGAPFWFNQLKTLANLRPLLADQIGQEEKAQPGPTGGQ